jgi:hypothetical protein
MHTKLQLQLAAVAGADKMNARFDTRYVSLAPCATIMHEAILKCYLILETLQPVTGCDGTCIRLHTEAVALASLYRGAASAAPPIHA